MEHVFDTNIRKKEQIITILTVLPAGAVFVPIARIIQ